MKNGTVVTLVMINGAEIIGKLVKVDFTKIKRELLDLLSIFNRCKINTTHVIIIYSF